MTSEQMFYCNFCKICKNTLVAEQHRTTASDYSTTNSSESKSANKTLNYDTKII